MPWREDEDLDKSGEMEEAAQELFKTGYFSWKGGSQKEKEQIEERKNSLIDLDHIPYFLEDLFQLLEH